MSAPASTLTRRPAARTRGRAYADRAAAALEPLRAELLRRARTAAAERLQRAAAEDAATISRAQQEAELVVEQARQAGVADVTVFLDQERARSRRQARAVVLGAHADALEQLRERSIAAVAGLTAEPEYPELHNRLVDYVRGQLGQDAAISDAATGGVIGTVPGRRLDCSFVALVEQVLVEWAAQPEAPWTT